MFFKKRKLIITHSGKFHADDLFAVAVLYLLFEKKGIYHKRTRDEKIIKTGDFVIDVGGIYDEINNRFDHHQSEGAGKRENGIPYSSLGLVWKKYGLELCGSEEVSTYLDKRFVSQIDAVDNGVNTASPIIDSYSYGISDLIYAWNPSWDEEKNPDQAFDEILPFAKKILEREIFKAQSKFKAEAFVKEAYNNSQNKKILVLDRDYPWLEVASKFKETYFIVSPKNGTWHVGAVREDPQRFKNKKDFPTQWAGKRDNELVILSGVKDAIFCHRNLFLAVALSKQGAIKLAQLALEN